MRKSRSRALFGVIALIATTMFCVAGTASAGTGVVICTGGLLTMDADGSATGSGTLTGCTDLLNPALHSATVQMSGLSTVKAPDEVDTTTTDTIHWNTGAVSRVTETRTFTTPVDGATVEAGAGAVVEGLLKPAAEAETGTGSESTHGDHVTFTISRALSTFDGRDDI